MKFRVLIEPWGVYVKTAEFFEAQGGLTAEWGQPWREFEADSIEGARAIGEKERKAKALAESARDLDLYP